MKVGLPEMEGSHGALDHERGDQQGDGDRQKRRAGVGGDAQGQPGHAERSIGDVQAADGQQQKSRSQQAHVKVLEGRFGAQPVVGRGGQDGAGEDQQLGKHKEVEQIAGQHGPRQAGSQRQKDGVKGRIAHHLVAAAQGVHDAQAEHNLAHDGHHCREQVAHDRDTKGRQPAARLEDQRLAAGPDTSQQPNTGRQAPEHRRQRPTSLQPLSLAQQQRHSRAGQRNENGQQHQVVVHCLA